jgi:hypothetical protein
VDHGEGECLAPGRNPRLSCSRCVLSVVPTGRSARSATAHHLATLARVRDSRRRTIARATEVLADTHPGSLYRICSLRPAGGCEYSLDRYPHSADTIEVLTVALGVSYLVHRFTHLNSLNTLAQYSFFAVIVAPVSVVFVGAFALHGNYWATWRISYFSEALALLALTPAILGWAGEARAWAKRPRSYYLKAAM